MDSGLAFVRRILTQALFPGHNEYVIKDKKRERSIGAFKVTPIKAKCAITNDSRDDSYLDYRKDFFQMRSKGIPSRSREKIKPAFGGL